MQVEAPSVHCSVDRTMRDIVIGSLSMMSAMALRELLGATLLATTAAGTRDTFVYVAALTSFTIFLTVLVVVYWE
jgi:hypothetical protein